MVTTKKDAWNIFKLFVHMAAVYIVFGDFGSIIGNYLYDKFLKEWAEQEL